MAFSNMPDEPNTRRVSIGVQRRHVPLPRRTEMRGVIRSACLHGQD
jgi:hypothetical protein